MATSFWSLKIGRWAWRALFVSVILAGLFIGGRLAYNRAVRPLPEVPVGMVMIEESARACVPFGPPVGYMRLYAKDADADHATLVTVGLLGQSPVFWVFYEDKPDQTIYDAAWIIVTLPGKSPEYLTGEELVAKYPRSVCGLQPTGRA